MKLGRFIVDTHVHAQRFAAGPKFAKQKLDTSKARYNDLARVMRTLTPYDNSAQHAHEAGSNHEDHEVHEGPGTGSWEPGAGSGRSTVHSLQSSVTP